MAATACKSRRQPLWPRSPAPVARTWTPRLVGVGSTFGRRWLTRLGVVVTALTLVGLALPLVAEVDRAIFDEVNAIGYGASWVFELLDPHERLYRGLVLVAVVVAFVVRGPWVALGAAVAVMLAATVSYVLLEAIVVVVDRPRPQEVFESILKPPGADWAQASYPSGHVTVTTAMAIGVALVLPSLRWPMILVTAVIAWSRMAFGAHFPLDVAAGLVLGAVSAAFSVALTLRVGLLPCRRHGCLER